MSDRNYIMNVHVSLNLPGFFFNVGELPNLVEQKYHFSNEC